MIARLAGKIVAQESKAIVLDVQGVGYRVTVMAGLLANVHLEQVIILEIYHHVSAESQDLFGFNNANDRHFFEMLLTVPTVGPRTAMNILDVAPPETLSQAVHENNTSLLTKVSGVGKKTAERIVLELKGKIVAPISASGHLNGGQQEEIVEVLASLGYTAAQARAAITELPTELTSVEEAVRIILQARGKK